jgi:hypothetical protein
MFEKFSPKPERKEAKQKRQEQIANLGQIVLIKEAERGVEPKRSGGYILSTVLAMALAMGMSAEKAKAQTRWPIGGTGKQLAGQIINRGIFEASSAIDRAHWKKMGQIENDYVTQLTILADAKRNLDKEYLQQKRQIMRSGEPDKERQLQELNTWYQTEAAKLEQNQIQVRLSYEKSKRKEEIKHGIINSVFRGARGW